MHPLPDPGIPFHTWHIDWIQDMPESSLGNTEIWVAVDRATRFTVAGASKRRDTASALQFLHGLSLQFGSPCVVITDRAKCFLSEEFQDYCKKNAIQHFGSTAYHPETNGMVERVNGLLSEMLSKFCAGSKELWDRFLQSAVYNLNARNHTVTGYSPFFLLYGFNPRLLGDTSPPILFDFQSNDERVSYTTRELSLLGHARAAAFIRSQTQQKKMAEKHDESSKVTNQGFEVGEFVKRIVNRLPSQFRKGKLDQVWEGPFIIDRVGPHDSYYLRRPDGQVEEHPVNFNHLEPYVNSQPQESNSADVSFISTSSPPKGALKGGILS
jgi:hypothetical protein